jgi:hypothetical protein
MYVGERESEILSLLLSAHDFIPKRVTFREKASTVIIIVAKQIRACLENKIKRLHYK